MAHPSVTRIRVEESQCGNSRYWREIFGVFSDDAVIVGEETRPPWADRDTHAEERSFSLNPACILRHGDWVASHTSSFRGDVSILAHRLPVAEVPAGWEPLAGECETSANGYGETRTWMPVSIKTGGGVQFKELAQLLGLASMPHPYGTLWLAGEMPVAMNAMPENRWSQDRSFSHSEIKAGLPFFLAKGYAAQCHHNKRAYYGAGDFHSCSEAILLKEQGVENLQPEGWYPLQVHDHYVVWAIGVHLYPKHLEWQSGAAPSAGDRETNFREADRRGTRLFDSSEARLERVKAFFKERIAFGSDDPQHVYRMLANDSDPRRGSWRNSYQYPDPWGPGFEGWELARFGSVECRWKQPMEGDSRFYGICR